MTAASKATARAPPFLRIVRALLLTLAATAAEAQAQAQAQAAPDLASRVMQLTRDTRWTPVAAVKIPFKTFHPQGMVKIGDTVFISSVEVRREPTAADPGEGVGHLFKVSASTGALLGEVRLGEGAVYHPGGIDADGRALWVPVSEYRPNSRAIVYTVDPDTLSATPAFRFADHLGAVAYDRAERRLHAMSWGSRRRYTWPAGFRGGDAGAAAAVRTDNPDGYIDYQDCHALPQSRMLCSGLADYPSRTGDRVAIGGVDLVDLKTGQAIWQAPISLRSPVTGRLMTQNPFFMEATATGLRAWFMPDDDSSTLFVFDATLQPPTAPVTSKR